MSNLTDTENYIVLLEDDPIISKVVEAACGMKTLSYDSVENFLVDIDKLSPIAILIDIHLNGPTSGLDVIPQVRDRWRYLPILVISADTDIELLARALASGANDFIKKPIYNKELTARLQARIREQARYLATSSRLVKDLKIDTVHGVLENGRNKRFLSQVDMQILISLLDANGSVVSRDVLKSIGWGNLQVSEKALDRKIHLIRAAVHEISDRIRIKAVYGQGFRIEYIENLLRLRTPINIAANVEF